MRPAVIGIDTYSIPTQAGAGTTVTVALFVGASGDVSCYRGVGSPEWVCAHGDRLSLDDAERHFPCLRRELTERGHTFGGRRFYPPSPESEDDPDKIGH